MRPVIPHQQPAIVHEATKKTEALVEKAIAAFRRGAEGIIEAGNALIEAKASCPHGEWLPTVKKKGLSDRTCRWLMARAKGKSATIADLDKFVDDPSQLTSTPCANPSKPAESRAKPVTKIEPPPNAGDAWEPPSEPEPPESPRRSTEPQNGQVRMDWVGYHLHYGGLLRICTHFAKMMGQVDERGAVVGDMHYRGIMRKLDEILKQTDDWYEKLTGEKPPRH